MAQLEQQPEARGIDVSKFGVHEVARPADLTILEHLADPLAEIARRHVEIMRDIPQIGKTTIRMLGNKPLAGEIVLESREPKGPIEIFSEGELGRNLPKIPKGRVFATDFDGTVFFQSAPGRNPYAKSGEIVTKDNFVLWFVATNKDTQFGIPAPATGIITYVVENAQAVKAEAKALEDGKEKITQEATILFYIDSDSPDKP